MYQTGSLSFADEADVDLFVTQLERFERGEIGEAEWRAFRLVHGTYGQRQPGNESMLRAKVPQGRFDARMLRALADVADRHSRGFCHVTTRQNVQFHFVPLEQVADAMRLLARAGITTKEACGNSVRNVTASATSGVAQDEVFDVTPYAEALTRHLLRHPLSSTLPRKMKIAFAGGGSDHAFAAINDIGWHAQIDAAGARGFRVTVAGGTATLCRSGKELFAFLPAGDLLALAEAIVRVFHALGEREHRHKSRMKFLVESLGWERFRDAVLAAFAEVRGQQALALPFDPEDPQRPEAPPEAREPRPSLQTLRQLVHATDTKGPGLHPRRLPLAGTAHDESTWMTTNVAPQKQEGFSLATVTLPLGDVTSGQLRALALLTRAYADGLARSTSEQNVVLRWVPNEELHSLYTALHAIGLGKAHAASVADVTSCPGAEVCKLAVTQSRGLARLLDDHFEGQRRALEEAGDLQVRVSGCPNGCGLHHVAGIGFQGALRKVAGRPVPQYFVSVGGGVSGAHATFGKVIAKIPARRIPLAVERLLGAAAAARLPGEDSASVLARLDPKALKAELADLEQLDESTAAPEDYVDLGETDAFRPQVGKGECAA